MPVYNERSAALTLLKLLAGNEEKEALFKRIWMAIWKPGGIYWGNLKTGSQCPWRFQAVTLKSMDDLFQIGCIGLIKAINNFDITPERTLFNVCRSHDTRRYAAIFGITIRSVSADTATPPIKPSMQRKSHVKKNLKNLPSCKS